MSDLVDMLRAFGEMPMEGGKLDPLIGTVNGLAHEAADEIDRLRAENERLAGRVAEMESGLSEMTAEADNCRSSAAAAKRGTEAATTALSDLRAAMRRLASMEAFTGSRAVDNPADQELLARINFAEAALSKDERG